MTRRTIWDQSAAVADWVGTRISGIPRWGDCAAIGLAEDDRLIAGVVYSRYFPGVMIDMSVAAEPGSRWVSRSFLRDVFRYPFVQLGLGRVQACIAADNAPSLRLCAGLGFQHEGTLRQAGEGGRDVLVFGLLRGECRWGEVHVE